MSSALSLFGSMSFTPSPDGAMEIRPPPIELDPRLLLGQTVWVRSAAEKWEVAVVTKITRKRARDDSAEKWYVFVQPREGGRLCIPYPEGMNQHTIVAHDPSRSHS